MISEEIESLALAVLELCLSEGIVSKMINPLNPPNKIFWLICPSHQVNTTTLCDNVFIIGVLF